MIAFGCAIQAPDAYRFYTLPGIERAAEPDSKIYAFSSAGSTYRSYNLLLDTAAEHEDLEALVLVHPHAQIMDEDFCAKTRAIFSDPAVAVAGAVGARNVSSLAWWEGDVHSGEVTLRYQQAGGGNLQAYAWAGPVGPPAEVDVVDGHLLVLSPWAVRNLRFDERLGTNHGFDVDFCLQAKAAGKKVVVGDYGLTQHRTIELLTDFAEWVETYIRLAHKWEGTIFDGPADDEAWRPRARRAEAEKEVHKAIAVGHSLHRDARVLALQREMDLMTSSTSWKLTSPLRKYNQRREIARQKREMDQFMRALQQ